MKFTIQFITYGKVKDLKNINTQLEYSNLDLSQITKFKTGFGIPTQGKASGTLKLQGPLLEKGKLDGLTIKTSFEVSNLSVPMEHNKKVLLVISLWNWPKVLALMSVPSQQLSRNSATQT